MAPLRLVPIPLGSVSATAETLFESPAEAVTASQTVISKLLLPTLSKGR